MSGGCCTNITLCNELIVLNRRQNTLPALQLIVVTLCNLARPKNIYGQKSVKITTI